MIVVNNPPINKYTKFLKFEQGEEAQVTVSRKVAGGSAEKTLAITPGAGQGQALEHAQANLDSALDPAAFERLRALLGSRSDELLPQLVEKFMAEAQQLSEKAVRLFAQGQCAELRLAIHTLKSNSAYFGANELSELCAQLERKARLGELEGMEGLLERITTAVDGVCAKLGTDLTPRRAPGPMQPAGADTKPSHGEEHPL